MRRGSKHIRKIRQGCGGLALCEVNKPKTGGRDVHLLLERMAPSSLFKYSPKSVTKLISFNSPFWSPVRHQHAPWPQRPRPTAPFEKAHTYASRSAQQSLPPPSCFCQNPADTSEYLTFSRQVWGGGEGKKRTKWGGRGRGVIKSAVSWKHAMHTQALAHFRHDVTELRGC